jgi:general secretion pathway protein G
MNQYNRRLKRSATEGGDAGFTLIELLIVIVVLGILAAIVVFALSGVTAKSTTAACQSDAKTVGVAVAALQAENPTQWGTYGTTMWQTNLTGPSSASNIGGPFLQSWPTGNAAYYTIKVAGQTAFTTSGDAVKTTNGDVIVTSVKSTKTYDATINPVSACKSL